MGYGKPPVATRFKPGQSGNPRGLPKGSKNKTSLPALNEERLKSIVLEEAYRTIKVNDGKGPVTLPMAQAIIRSLAVNAAKGNQRAQRLFTELLATTERDNRLLHDEYLQTAIEYKFNWEQELAYRRRHGIDAPDPIPHPDHVIVDVRTGSVQITGPITTEEKALWDMAYARKDEADREIANLEKLLRDNPKHPHRKQVLQDLEHERKIRAIIAPHLPDRPHTDEGIGGIHR